MKIKTSHPDYFLDITDDICPMTFVKVRLQIEKMLTGELLEIRLKGSEPLKNVPASVMELGHSILSVHNENKSPEYWQCNIFRITIKKEVSI